MIHTTRPILLDSHIFIWALEQPNKIGPETRRLIESGIEVFVSTVTLWELAIKYRLKKFPYDTDSLVTGMLEGGFSLLTITPRHIQMYPKIKLSHNNDPFDILLTAQANAEEYPFITADHKILTASQAYTLHNALQ